MPLLSALSNKYVKMVKFFFKKRVDLTITNDGWTPLNVAFFNGHFKVVKLLLIYNHMDLNLSDKKSCIILF